MKTASDKHFEYTKYAEHCLKVVRSLPDRESRCTLREMAAEWFRLAEAHEQQLALADLGQQVAI
jgi:hypothetical protein